MTDPVPTSDENSAETRSAVEDYPLPLSPMAADSSPAHWLTWAWWLLPVIGLIVAGWLVIAAAPAGGSTVRVRFDQGYGIKPGDRLRYRGIDVGSVEGVELNDERGGVVVVIALMDQATNIAREGSQFWIERPQVSLSRISGLETVVGAKYLGVVPGPADSPPARIFEGLSAPPLMRDGQSLEIVIRFREGHGLTAGDVVQHRGIVVGEVTAVELTNDFEFVLVRVRLSGAARNLARVGTQFWIERPHVSVTEIRALETLVRGRHLAVKPAPPDADPSIEFEGLDTVPVAGLPEGGLEIVLESARRQGLEAGAPVSYRGQQIGKIVSVGLSTDAATIEARAVIEPDFRPLVRQNSEFWSNGGFHVQGGLTGFQIDIDTVSTLVAGGVSLYTPEEPAAEIATGHRFKLNERAGKGWLDSTPRIPLGSLLLPRGASVPDLSRATLQWQRSSLGIQFSKSRRGWILPLQAGRFLGPSDMLTIVEVATADSTVLETEGAEFPLTEATLSRFGAITLFEKPDATDAVAENKEELAAREQAELRAWPPARLRAPQQPEECILIADPQSLKLPLGVARITVKANAWSLDPSLPVNVDWHGGCAVSRVDGCIIGVLLVDEHGPRIAPLTKDLIKRVTGE